MAHLLDLVTPWLWETFVRVTIDAALCAAPVWALCRFVTATPATVRAWLWWCVSLKMLLSAAGVPLLQVPAFPESWIATRTEVSRPAPLAAASTTPATPLGSGQHTGPGRPASDLVTPGRSQRAATAGGAVAGWTIWRVLTLLWLGGLTVHALRLIPDAAALRRIRNRAVPVPAEIAAQHQRLAGALGLSRVPSLLASTDVTVPQVVGLFRPTVLIPVNALSSLSDDERAMVLCHELMHVRRNDLALAWVPALAVRVLVWHPIAAIAAREYALAREAACDRDVLATLRAEAHDYGRLLVRLGVGRAAAGVAAAGASPSFKLLRRRLHMLKDVSPRTSRLVRLALTAPALAIVALLPLQFVAADAAAPETVIVSGPDAVDAAPIAPAATPAPARAATAAATETGPAAASAAQSIRTTRRGRDSSWVLLRPGNDVSMRGSSEDVDRARAQRKSSDDTLFYFRRDGREYVIEDKGALAEIERIFGPMMELGRQQGELGDKQGRLGERQGALGAEQGALGSRQGELGAKQGDLAAMMARANADVLTVAAERMRRRESQSADDLIRQEAEAKARMSKLEREMEQLAAQQRALGDQQAALGEKQAVLGGEQGKLGEEQARLGELQRQASEKADQQLRALVERAVADGRARSLGVR